MYEVIDANRQVIEITDDLVAATAEAQAVGGMVIDGQSNKKVAGPFPRDQPQQAQQPKQPQQTQQTPAPVAPVAPVVPVAEQPIYQPPVMEQAPAPVPPAQLVEEAFAANGLPSAPGQATPIPVEEVAGATVQMTQP